MAARIESLFYRILILLLEFSSQKQQPTDDAVFAVAVAAAGNAILISLHFLLSTLAALRFCDGDARLAASAGAYRSGSFLAFLRPARGAKKSVMRLLLEVEELSLVEFLPRRGFVSRGWVHKTPCVETFPTALETA